MKGRLTLEAAGLRLEAEFEDREELEYLLNLRLVEATLKLKEGELERVKGLVRVPEAR